MSEKIEDDSSISFLAHHKHELTIYLNSFESKILNHEQKIFLDS